MLPPVWCASHVVGEKPPRAAWDRPRVPWDAIKVKPAQGRDCQAPELVLGHQLVAHVATQDMVRHGHRLLNPREPACVVAEWHRRDIRRRGHRVRQRVRVISASHLPRPCTSRLPRPEPLSRKRTGDGPVMDSDRWRVVGVGWRVVGGGWSGWWV